MSKYYKIAEVLNDNLRDVAIAIRIAGCTHKPARIHSDLVEGWVDKYHEELDFLMDTIQHEKASHLLFAYIRDIRQLSHKFNFSMTHETKIGAINENYIGKKREVRVIKNECPQRDQMLLIFGEVE